MGLRPLLSNEKSVHYLVLRSVSNLLFFYTSNFSPLEESLVMDFVDFFQGARVSLPPGPPQPAGIPAGPEPQFLPIKAALTLPQYFRCNPLFTDYSLFSFLLICPIKASTYWAAVFQIFRRLIFKTRPFSSLVPRQV